jgi:hypothetical protein
MPIFKPKNTKKILIPQNNVITLDNKHTELLQEFNDNECVKIPVLILKKKELLKKMSKVQNIDKQLELNDEIKNISIEIKKLKTKRKKYYLDNSKYIFDYFENKKQIEDGKNKIKKLDSFFNIKSSKDDNIQDNVIENSVEKYLYNVDEGFFDMNKYILPKDICRYCNQGELIPIEHEGVLVCKNNECGKNVRYLVENEKPSYKEPPKEVCFYAYKRINHFREILAQFQAKETTQINPEVLENIEQQIKKERISLNEITTQKAKEILKKLGYNKYYEHIPFIKDKLGIKPPIMSPELEETLCNLFMDIQGPYAKYCPDDRVNFLNYYYTVYKLCELLNQDKFLPFFPLLKDKEKMIEQDEIWKKICEELDWEFIPTV